MNISFKKTLGAATLVALGLVSSGCNVATDRVTTVLKKADFRTDRYERGDEPPRIEPTVLRPDGRTTMAELGWLMEQGSTTKHEKKIAEFLLKHFNRIAAEHSTFGIPIERERPDGQAYLAYLRSYISEADIKAIAAADGNPKTLSEKDLNTISIRP